MLSNATMMEGICEDRLPESPREASLIAGAARADVPGMLQQQVGGVGPDAAVRLTAGTGRPQQTTEGSGNCGSFATFSPTCETIYGPGHTSEGHMVEYMFENEPDITFTVDKHLLMIDMQGSNGDSLLNWWKVIPPPRLAAGS